ncbi:hypothetical protein LR48_Vigan07g107400 [Vigna angularis]|uniref:Uncharacterized protein n=1 Tax=Phaseolus angularis TaxID=3914 RepID=A0A0L9UWY6_PHAAN|nr:hypothetical protein LR48_Vigan07g107400 [Vigna angularis]
MKMIATRPASAAKEEGIRSFCSSKLQCVQQKIKREVQQLGERLPTSYPELGGMMNIRGVLEDKGVITAGMCTRKKLSSSRHDGMQKRHGA